jgi:hypothetical protein
MAHLRFAVWVLPVVLFVGSEARADSVRCGERLASTGDSTYEVKAQCGDPDAANHRVEYRTVRVRVPASCVVENGQRRCEAIVEHTVEIQIDEWIYDFGKNRFIEHLTFEQGQLIRVANGGYGHKDAT